jgi:hypothetical protein
MLDQTVFHRVLPAIPHGCGEFLVAADVPLPEAFLPDRGFVFS